MLADSLIYIFRELGQDIADLTFNGISIEGKVREKSAIITASVNSSQMLNPCNGQVVFFTKKVCVLLILFFNCCLNCNLVHAVCFVFGKNKSISEEYTNAG